MKFKLSCTKCGSTDVQPFFQTNGLVVDNHHIGLNCRDCGNIATMPELETEWLGAIHAKHGTEQNGTETQ